MNVVVAMDGSKYGHWALHWVPKLPLVESPKVLALHVLDRAPYSIVLCNSYQQIVLLLYCSIAISLRDPLVLQTFS